MTTRPPITVGESEWERGLWWMVAASGGLHLVAIALLLLVPHTFLHHPPPMLSYTVDLVAPDKVGGTNVIPGGKGRIDAPPMAVAPAPRVAPPPPPPKVEEPKPPEPPKVQPPKPEPVEVAKEPAPPPEPPKVEPKPKEDEAALAEKVKKVEPPPAPTVAKPAATPAPTPQARPAPSANVVAKAGQPKPQPSVPPKIDAKAAKAAADAKAAEANAVKVAAEAKARDDRIAAAIKRVEQQNGTRGGGTGSKTSEPPGGPISVGPGEGAGGSVRGVEYLLYYNQLITRIRQSWAWASAGQDMEAAVRFSISGTGEVLDVRITHPSGDSSYDASVERAVRAVNPLPPPPAGYKKEFSDVELTFRPNDLKM